MNTKLNFLDANNKASLPAKSIDYLVKWIRSQQELDEVLCFANRFASFLLFFAFRISRLSARSLDAVRMMNANSDGAASVTSTYTNTYTIAIPLLNAHSYSVKHSADGAHITHRTSHISP